MVRVNKWNIQKLSYNWHIIPKYTVSIGGVFREGSILRYLCGRNMITKQNQSERLLWSCWYIWWWYWYTLTHLHCFGCLVVKHISGWLDWWGFGVGGLLRGIWGLLRGVRLCWWPWHSPPETPVGLTCPLAPTKLCASHKQCVKLCKQWVNCKFNSWNWILIQKYKFANVLNLWMLCNHSRNLAPQYCTEGKWDCMLQFISWPHGVEYNCSASWVEILRHTVVGNAGCV